MKKILIIGLSLLILAGCTSKGKEPDKVVPNENEGGQVTEVFEANPEFTMMATITTNQGVIKAELYQDLAPETVNNFATLANSGFYDGVIFHRVISGFMIQGGDPDGRGTGGPGYNIKGEFAVNGHKNLLRHDRGVLSMARTNDVNGAGSQFFIMHADSPHLDGNYAAFGKVVEGLDVVDKIAAVTTAAGDVPTEPMIIENITVDVNGLDISDFTKLK